MTWKIFFSAVIYEMFQICNMTEMYYSFIAKIKVIILREMILKT